MGHTITEELVRRAVPKERTSFLRDDKLRGFALRITATGAKSFVAEGRVNGRTRRFTIASAERLSVSDARAKAKQLLAGMSEGHDPQLERRAARVRADTIRALIEEHVEDKGLRNSTARRYRGAVERCADDWLDRSIDLITPSMVQMRYKKVTQRSIADANNFARVLGAISRYAMRSLPAKADGRPRIERPLTDELHRHWRRCPPKKTLLEPHDVAPWWKSVQKLRSVESKGALITILLTGLRVNEVLRLRWQDVNALARKLEILESKTDRFTKIIGPELAKLLASWRADALDSDLVFNVRDLRTALEQTVILGAKRITPHDLRRTYLTFAERVRTPFLISKKLVNHSTKNDVTAAYINPSEDDQRYWAAKIERAILLAAQGGKQLTNMLEGRAN